MSWGQDAVNHLGNRTPDAPRRGVTFADSMAGPPNRRYGRCPECGEFVAIDPKGPSDEAPCPGCNLRVRPSDLHWPIRVEEGPFRLSTRGRSSLLRWVFARLFRRRNESIGAPEMWDDQVDG